jgi:hypothetical protein
MYSDPFEVEPTNIEHSFFVRTAVDWNHLDENTVSAEKLESFKSALAVHRH